MLETLANICLHLGGIGILIVVITGALSDDDYENEEHYDEY